MKTDQVPLEVELAQKSMHASLLTFLSTLAMVAIAVPSATRGGWWAGMVAFSGISLMSDAYSLKSNATLLEQYDQRTPAWLEYARFLALVGGPIVLATGIWLAFRR